MKHKRILAILLIAVLLIASEALADGGYKDRIRIGINAEPQTVLTPTKSTSAMCQMIGRSTHSTLVDTDLVTNETKPDLAESWEVFEDGARYIFHLRQGVKFSNGQELTAEDVKFTFDERFPAGALSAMARTIAEVNVIDPYTVEFVLTGPVQDFLYVVSGVPASIVCKSAVEAEGDTGEQYGTGAFSITKYQQGEYVLLTRNEDYFGEKPLTKELEFAIYLEDSTRLVSLEAGEIDIAYAIANADIEFIEDNPDLKLEVTPGTNIYYIAFNTPVAPFDNEKLRQAIACAVDKESGIMVAFEGLADVATSVMVPAMPLYTPVSVYDYDIDRAKELLAEAGYPDGGLEFTMWVDRADEEYLGITFQENLKQIGINLKVERLEATTLKASWNDPNYQVALQKFGPTFPDINFSYVFASTASANRSHVNDPYVDEMIAKAAAEPDSAVRTELYRELNTYITEKAYWVPIAIPQIFAATRADVEGAVYAGNTAHDFTYVHVAEN